MFLGVWPIIVSAATRRFWVLVVGPLSGCPGSPATREAQGPIRRRVPSRPTAAVAGSKPARKASILEL
jgi:hypothetical protein